MSFGVFKERKYVSRELLLKTSLFTAPPVSDTATAVLATRLSTADKSFVGKPDAYWLKAIQNPSGKSRGRCDCRYPSLEKLKPQKLDHQKNDILGRR